MATPHPRALATKEYSTVVPRGSNTLAAETSCSYRTFTCLARAFAAGDLAGRESLAALLFRLEQAYPPAHLDELIDEVIGWFRRHPNLGELSRLFAELVAPAISRIGTQAEAPHDLLEMKSMLATRAEVWEKELLAEGEVKGKAELLVRLLTARFGALPPAVRKGIGAADLATLERWFDHAIEASDLPSVFRHDPSPSVDQGSCSSDSSIGTERRLPST